MTTWSVCATLPSRSMRRSWITHQFAEAPKANPNS